MKLQSLIKNANNTIERTRSRFACLGRAVPRNTLPLSDKFSRSLVHGSREVPFCSCIRVMSRCDSRWFAITRIVCASEARANNARATLVCKRRERRKRWRERETKREKENSRARRSRRFTRKHLGDLIQIAGAGESRLD